MQGWLDRLLKRLRKGIDPNSLRFAREAGYRTITLWTQAQLLTARHIYEKAGFRLAHVEKHHHFGPEMIGEVWELTL